MSNTRDGVTALHVFFFPLAARRFNSLESARLVVLDDDERLDTRLAAARANRKR
jgi:hypothetical protein